MWLPTKTLVDMSLPVWYHGYRCHGYWLDGKRVGFIGLTPPGYCSVTYSWGLDDIDDKGECSTLAAAKRRVAAAFKLHYSWRFPASRDRGR